MRTWLLAAIVVMTAMAASAQVGITVTFGPPPLPIYEQPICPGDGYLWTPGYWAWDGDDYYWVPGTWVLAPEVGYLWTPPWWGWDNGVFLFHDGFWGPEVGFYGGINYGFGYFGTGYMGGRWEGGRFFYNRSVTNINVVNVRNVYNERVVVRNESHVAFNGGEGGIHARPTPAEEAAARGRRMEPVAAQMRNRDAARGNPEFRANENHGRPPVAATDHPGEFRGSNVVPARAAGGEYRRPANRGGAPGNAGNRNYTHARDLPPMEHPGAPNTGNAKLDQKYQKQQQKLYQQQNKDRQKLERQQAKEDARMQKQQANQARQQQMEQRHQQQTQQMQERHQMQMRNLQSREGGGRPPGGGERPR